jgi:hypothetical protein
VFAPYAESWLSKYDGLSLDQTPPKWVTLAFVLGANGVPKFDGTMPLDAFAAATKKIRAKGGDVRISFGGATGTELAVGIQDPDKLFAAYDSVVRAYDAKYIDLDIEGGSASDAASVSRRNAAMKRLQDAHPGLKIDYTLGVMPHGLDASGVKILLDAKKHGVKVNAVNIMNMDYGTKSKDMGGDGIKAAQATKKQLDTNGIDACVGLTPMIGLNDTTPETFTIADARAVLEFAQKTPWINFVGFWALGRDRQSVSKTPQKDWEFCDIFGKFA